MGYIQFSFVLIGLKMLVTYVILLFLFLELVIHLKNSTKPSFLLYLKNLTRNPFMTIGLLACAILFINSTKILALRLKQLLHDIISSEQAIFLPSRRASDHIILGQEALQYVNRTKTQKFHNIIIKIDMEKVFDRLEWAFIRQVLKFFNLPDCFIQLIMKCISSASYSILINSFPYNFLLPQ